MLPEYLIDIDKDFIEGLKARPQVVIALSDAFELEAIFGCGQAFRWYKIDGTTLTDSAYFGIVDSEAVLVYAEASAIICIHLGCADKCDPHGEVFWRNYFDADRSYSLVIEQLNQAHPELSEATEFGKGLRLLNQNHFEMLMTFILSANNNIPRIMASVERLSESFGKPIALPNGERVYSFPEASHLAEASLEDLKACGVGYRNVYLKASATLWLEKHDHEWHSLLNTLKYEEAKELLQTFDGVGPKVADCILLFASSQHNAFPIDTWISKALQRYYCLDGMGPKALNQFVEKQFAELKGFAQQYIFHFERNGRVSF